MNLLEGLDLALALHSAARVLQRDAEVVVSAHLHAEHVEVRLGGFDRRKVAEMTGLGGAGLGWAVSHLVLDDTPEAQWLADAVAIAAIQAAAGKRPRAVLLVLGDGDPGHGRHTPAQALQLLRALRVPLYVWYAGSGADDAGGGGGGARRERLAEVRRAWGEGEEVRLVDDLVRASQTLRRDLDRQRVVWLDGRWLPAEIELRAGGAGEGARLVE
jgi:hypothetical protein